MSSCEPPSLASPSLLSSSPSSELSLFSILFISILSASSPLAASSSSFARRDAPRRKCLLLSRAGNVPPRGSSSSPSPSIADLNLRTFLLEDGFLSLVRRLLPDFWAARLAFEDFVRVTFGLPAAALAAAKPAPLTFAGSGFRPGRFLARALSPAPLRPKRRGSFGFLVPQSTIASKEAVKFILSCSSFKAHTLSYAHLRATRPVETAVAYSVAFVNMGAAL